MDIYGDYVGGHEWPRKARMDAPGALQHIVLRGIERLSIFEDDADLDSFIKRLGEVLLKSHTPCHAWSLMTNHGHLLLRTGGVPPATLMGSISVALRRRGRVSMMAGVRQKG